MTPSLQAHDRGGSEYRCVDNMTAQLLASELANLIQESKRKNSELRSAAEKSLDELKSLRTTSEAQVAADLSLRPNFVTPFLIACGTKNAKFTGISVVCLQRLVAARALPKSRLREILDAFREATSAGQDVQLKLLQALPSLLHNYSEDIKGDLIAASLNICTVLQSSKNGIVNNTAAATLQQLVVSVFDKVVTEDKISLQVPTIGEVPAEDGKIQVRAAALDAYKVFNDLCLLTESQKPRFLRPAGLPQTFGLELIESVLTNHADIFLSHPEQANILRTRVMPFIISSLSEKLNFAVTVRIVRILFTLLRRHLSILSSEGEMALGLIIYMLDQDTALWKRSLIMEILRGIFSDAALVRRIFSMYDAAEGKKPILRELTAAFVRISTERPAIIGLSSQSTIPLASQADNSGNDQAMLEASGVHGIISSSVGSSEPIAGISTQWSTMRVPCIDQLDKTDPPMVPDSYIYSLTIACINGLAEGLAKFILPLTVPERLRKKPAKQNETEDERPETPGVERTSSSSYKKNPIPVNPLALEEHPYYEEVKICAGVIEECWPAVLATCSTFLYAALDTEYYHGLVRSFQKFTHVAGLLRLSTPRDAFLTTLGKAAVPPNVLTATTAPVSVSTPPATESSSIFSNARGLLSVDTIVSQGDRSRQSSVDVSLTSLNTRNLLCLRALLNLGIALGPTLDSAWIIVIGTLQQADLVLFSSSKAPRTPTPTMKPDIQSSSDNSALLANFGPEVKAVEVAAMRLVESTIDFPDYAFVEVVNAFCNLLGKESDNQPESTFLSVDNSPKSALAGRRPSSQHRRIQSINIAPASLTQEDLFALTKLGDLASINIERLTTVSSEVSGWEILTSELISVATCSSTASSVRFKAAEILVRTVLEATGKTLAIPDSHRGPVQIMLLNAFSRALRPLQEKEREVSLSAHSADIEVHKIVLEGLKSMLEHGGEIFIDGWDIAFEIIGSVFMPNEGGDSEVNGMKPTKSLSARLIRSSFGSLQLICSDFLSSLPNSCVLMLVDTLYYFSTQDDDLNISLTTVTFFWVLSDFISGRTSSFTINLDRIQGSDEKTLVKMASREEDGISNAALWMLLLLRLTVVTTDERLELRNSAIQTLFRIFDAYGEQLSTEAWSMCLEAVIFKLLASIEEQLLLIHSSESLASEKDKSGWHETTVVVLGGVTSLFAEYLDSLTKHSKFETSWATFLSRLRSLLKLGVIEVNTGIFKSLQKILSRGNIEGNTFQNFNEESIELVWKLWSQSLPVVNPNVLDKRLDNENYLLAYVSALREIYRLMEKEIDVEHIRRMLYLLREAIQRATAASYTADIEYQTSLQTGVLEAIRMVRTDIEGVPAALIDQVAEFSALAFAAREGSQQPTYVALSKASMVLLEKLILEHSSEQSIYQQRAVLNALLALSKPIVLKYSFPIGTKSLSPWRQATTTSLAIVKAILPKFAGLELPDDILKSLWESIVVISNGITAGDFAGLPEPSEIKGDEAFDISSFLELRKLIVPALGAPFITDKTRQSYTESLFRMSFVHPFEGIEIPQLTQMSLAPLYKPRKGRTIDPTPSPRQNMSYVCLSELVSLLSAQNDRQEWVRLSQAAAPYLILRTGLTLRAYIADQPLRGRMPQPYSQRKELLYILQALVKLDCEPKAIPDTPRIDSESKKHLHRLYPLLARAVRAAARDEEVLKWIGKALDEVGMEFGL